MDINIIETYKAASSKLEVIDRLARETGKTVPEIFVELQEAKCCDGRFFRQGRYAKEWNEAKKIIKENNLKRAAEATTSFADLKKANEQLVKDNKSLQKQLENAKNSHDVANDADLEAYHKTIDTQKEEIDKLNGIIENQQKSYQEAFQQMKDENEAADVLIEDLRNVLSLREDEVKELNEKIVAMDRSDEISDLISTISIRDQRIAELEKSLEHHKVSDFNATVDGMQLELQVSKKDDEITRLKKYIRGLEEQLEEQTPSNGDTLKRQLDETTQNYNEAMLMNKKLEEQIKYYEDEKKGDGLIIRDQFEKISVLENKLAKAEAYVLNHVLYEV